MVFTVTPQKNKSKTIESQKSRIFQVVENYYINYLSKSQVCTFHHESQNEGVNPRAKNPDNAQPNDEEDVRNSYASAAKAAAPEREFPVSYVPDEQNEVPERPCTAFVNPRTRIPARDFFEALNNAEIDSNHLSCIQRLSSGEVLLTFRSPEFRDQFLRRNVLEIKGQPFALQDVDKILAKILTVLR